MSKHTAESTESARTEAVNAAPVGAPHPAVPGVALGVDMLEDAYYEVDLAGRLVRFNRAACVILGRSHDEMTGLHYRSYMPPKMAESVGRLFGHVYETGQASRGSDWTILHHDSSLRYVEGSVALVRNAAGEPVGFCGIMRDVTARRAAEAALRESEARFRALTDLSSDWYWEQDSEYRLVRFEGSGRTSRYNPAQQVLGKRLWELRDILLDEAQWAVHRAVLENRKVFHDLEYSYLSRSGKRYDMSLSGAPNFDDEGQFTGYRGTARNISARKRDERLLGLEHAITHELAGADNERSALRHVLRAICESEAWDAAGYFEIVDSAGTMRLVAGWSAGTASPQAEALRNAQLGQLVPAGGALTELASRGEPVWLPDGTKLDSMHEDWRLALSLTDEHALLVVPIKVDGQAIAVLGFSSRNMPEPDQRLKRAMRVIAEQVTQFLRRNRAEATLRDSEARFRALTHLSSDWYWELDEQLCFSRIGGQGGEDRHASAVREVLGRHPWDIGLALPDGERWSDIAASLRAREPLHNLIVALDRSDGSQKYVSISGEPIVDDAVDFRGYRGVGRDITDQVVAEQRIQHLATHDSLTGLPNRAHFDALLQRTLDTVDAAPFAVMFIDLDGFKAVNDSLGHEAGDTLLCELARRMASCVRDGDVVARMGGDEFIVLVHDIATDADIQAVAQKIGAICAQPVQFGERRAGVTTSIGVARHPDHAGSAPALVRAADLSMYEAKRAGKNRCAIFSDLQPGAFAGTATGTAAKTLLSRQWAPV